MVCSRKKTASWVFRYFMFLFCFILIIRPTCGNDTLTSNVMKIVHPKSLLRYNTEMRNNKILNDSNYDEAESYIPYDLQIVVEALMKLNSSQCLEDGKMVLEAIAKRERWALNLFDASSKFPVGILFGSFYQLGNFDECVAVKQTHAPDPKKAIQGQYCLADVELFKTKEYDGRVARSFETVKKKPRIMFNSTIHWAICVPSSCTPAEVEIVVREIFTLATDHKISVKLDANKCHANKEVPWSVLEIVYGSVVGTFFVFILMATGFHYLAIKQKKRSLTVGQGKANGSSTLKQVVICFSLIRTIGKLLQTKSSDMNLDCISGIKFLSMALIICGHTMLFMLGGPVQNTDFFERESYQLPNAIFLNSPLLVDTFMLVSGFLMCYLFIKELEKRKGHINFLILYFARYNRLTPSYLVVIGFYCTLFFRIGDGPLWDTRVAAEQERCLKSWWANLLYINNYVNTENLCIFQSWYLAVDFHLFIIAPFILYPLWKWPKYGKGLLGTCTVISIILPFIITLKDKEDPTLMSYPPEMYDISKNMYFIGVYVKTHMRASSYFLGLILGYLMHNLQTKGTKIPQYIIWIGWCVSAVFGIISMFSVVTFYTPEHEYNGFEAAVYAPLHRVAWCIAIGWILIVCITDNAAMVNAFLSWKFFMPLSRLTYCAYLANGMIEIYSFSTLRSGIHMSKFDITCKVLAHLVLTFVSAFVLCLFFESPIHGLEKILLRNDSRKRRKEPVDQPTIDDSSL